MAKQQVTQTKSTTRTRVKKNGGTNGTGYRQCNICHGTSVIKVAKSPSGAKKGKKR